jgi:hypothetical protein
MQRVLASAAKLQEVVPDAVLVGGSAAALYAGHRDSFDHGWATSVRASKPPFTIMGRLGGVEAGLRQLRRVRPLETVEIDVGGGAVVVAPTEPEALRVKAYLVVQRNVVRDHLDVVALAEHLGEEAALAALLPMDDYYADRSGEPASVLTALVAALADPHPHDTEVIDELSRYKGLAERWHRWSDVVEACQELALRLSGAV